MAEVVSWDLDMDPKYAEVLVDTAAAIGECTYPHTSYAHQRFVAMYTVSLAYVDDTAPRMLDEIKQFGQRIMTGQPQLHPALTQLAELFKTAHELYPSSSADAIVTNAIDGISSMRVEAALKSKGCSSLAPQYPYYLRLRCGIASGYAHLSFVKDMEDVLGTSYLQLLP